MEVIRRLSIARKFLLIFILYLIPVGYVALNTINKNSASLDIVQQEINELQLINLFRSTLTSMAAVRGLTNAYLNGDVSVKIKISQLAEEVDLQFNLIKKNKNYSDLYANQKSMFIDIERDWLALKKNSFERPPAEVFTKYSQLLSATLSLTGSIKELGVLMTDSQKNTSFLIRILIDELPLLSEITGQTRGIGAGVAARKKFNSDTFISLSNKYQQLVIFKQQFFSRFERAIDNEPSLAIFEPDLERFKQSLGEFIITTQDKLIAPDTILIDSASYFKQGTRVIRESQDLQEQLYSNLSVLFASREQVLVQEIGLNVMSSLVLILAAIYLFSCFYKNMLESISQIKTCVDGVAEGDLTRSVAIQSNDEMKVIGEDINRMVENTKALVCEVSTTTNELVETAENSSATAVSTRQRISQQNVEVEQVATAMNQMSATVQDVAGNAEKTAASSASADSDSKHGLKILKETTVAINELASELDSAVLSINELQSNVDGIGSVLDVIQGIADQTNLLALNAAIEAARAGESGRGFAVVADEVRTLASKTQESTEEIRKMIDKLQKSAGQSVNAMVSGNEKSQQTVEAAERAGTALTKISESVGAISIMSEQIASAATEQSAVADEVNQSIINVKGISQSTEESALNSEKESQFLSEVASNLKALIARFIV